MVYLFLADGFEEIEALTPADLMRRAGIEVVTVGVGKEYITGAHSICVKADITDAEAAAERADTEMVILPGGMPGTLNLDRCPTVHKCIEYAEKQGAYLAAICAAPSVFGKRGMLDGKNAICYPGFEKELVGAKISSDTVVRDGKYITAKAAGCAVEFALELISVLRGDEAAAKVRAAVFA